MLLSDIKTAAIIGTGLIGQGWAIRFALAGLSVRAYDKDEQTLSQCKLSIAHALEDMQAEGLCEDISPVLDRISIATSIEHAVSSADYVQESVLELVEVKQAVCTEIDRHLPDHALVGSSSSGIAASVFTEKLTHRDRFYVVHPVNPPHLVPVVEIVPAPWSSLEHIELLRGLLEKLGQSPVLVHREIEGFILNRLQGALLNEAWSLYEEGFASAEDIDRTIRDGLGRRWAFMGPFETISLNAPGGIEDYAKRLSPLYHKIALSRTKPKQWSTATAKRIATELADKGGNSSREHALANRNKKLMQMANLYLGWANDADEIQ